MKLSDFFQGVKEIKVTGPKIIHQFDVFGLKINLTESIVIGWIIIIAIAVILKALTAKSSCQKKTNYCGMDCYNH